MTRVCRSVDDSVSAEVSAVHTALSSENSESECLALAQEGERLIRDNEIQTGVQFLEKAIEVGTKKVQLLTAIYSQLGNAYFSTRSYLKALQYHHNDLLITKLMKDPAGEAKACGNLGNTYKALGKYDDAIYYCQVHLRIAKNIDDQSCIARALYNLATVYHAKGRQSHSQPASQDLTLLSVHDAYKADLNMAVELYKENLALVEALDDPYARGRTYGNLGNVFYLLGDFDTAVLYHQKRLDIARQFGDRPAMRRAYSNLGNAHVYMSKLEEAVQYYKLALAVAVEQGDRIGEAQVCFGLGNAATIQGDYNSSAEYHRRHLTLARDLKDRAGEARACASLAVNYDNMDDRPKAIYFLALNKKLAMEMRDHAMEVAADDQIRQMIQANPSLIFEGQVKIDDSADPLRQVDGYGGMRENLAGSRSLPNLLSSSLQSLIMKSYMANSAPLDASIHSSTSVDCGLSRTSANELYNAIKGTKVAKVVGGKRHMTRCKAKKHSLASRIRLVMVATAG
ncbi:hypothetical protein L596_020071 [Steinernema carpocapsae]|uniref:MalT-like TPR region domain-containing protein n=1 Tax=Steinernema carpocapsae TaxID=34508 RepID=A0A4U5MSN3_STECR|nr:hypothetical protein L596_020071 [Steinernema carpocapsae]